MLTSATSVIERRLPISGLHTTHPYEVGWALETVAFVQTEQTEVDLTIHPQISPDGLHWVDIGPSATLRADDDIIALRLTTFGGWLRLRIEGASPESPARVLIHFALKG